MNDVEKCKMQVLYTVHLPWCRTYELIISFLVLFDFNM